MAEGDIHQVTYFWNNHFAYYGPQVRLDDTTVDSSHHWSGSLLRCFGLEHKFDTVPNEVRRWSQFKQWFGQHYPNGCLVVEGSFRTLWPKDDFGPQPRRYLPIDLKTLRQAQDKTPS